MKPLATKGGPHMTPEWKEFLVNAGAEIQDDCVTNFGNPDLELRVVTTGNVIADLSHMGLLCIRGEDAQSFLQGQLTNDVRAVSETRSQLTAYCSPKGRMLANGRLFLRDGAYYLRQPREMLDAILKRLRLFVLRARVTLEDATDSLVHFGLSGPTAEAELQNALGAVPDAVDAVIRCGEVTAIRIHGPHPRFELYGPVDEMKRLWTALDVQGVPIGATPWALLDILAGVPTVYPETVEAFVPQMVNLQLLNGVSFNKGCYTGQEVIARTQFLGKLKRRMYRAHVDTGTTPKPGDELYSPATEPGQSAGRIVDAKPWPDGGFEVLAVVQIANVETTAVRLGGPEGPELHFGELPYAFEPPEA